MSSSEFYKYLGITTIFAGLLAVVTGYFLPKSSYMDLSAFAIIFFVLLSLLVFQMGKRAATSSNKFQYVNLIISNMMLKMLMSFVIVLIYAQLKNPPDKLFVIPFLVIYLIFTAFETYFMTIQSKTKKNG